MNINELGLRDHLPYRLIIFVGGLAKIETPSRSTMKVHQKNIVQQLEDQA